MENIQSEAQMFNDMLFDNKKELKKHIRKNGFLKGTFEVNVPNYFRREKIWTSNVGEDCYHVITDSDIEYHCVNNVRIPGQTKHTICLYIQRNNFGSRLYLYNKKVLGEGRDVDVQIRTCKNYVVKLLEKCFKISYESDRFYTQIISSKINEKIM